MMSRRPPNPAAERGAQNQQTLKTLVKVESNKSCADCKKNKHPRWASWNLGIFLCIRCSGIHRGMGTHISRVKSVDLDAWTDEQLASMLKWGNARANKYWESKLSPGHVPADGKIENFIRTKYESRRWVMDGPMPDPSTLDVAGDDEVPLNVIQEKAKLERSGSARVSSAPTAAPLPQPRPPPKQQINLFDDDPPPPPASRPNSVANPGTRAALSQPSAAPAKPNKTGDSLLGFDFFGPTSTNPPPRPSSAAASTPGTSSGPSRPDLKQSILSLYAAKPQPAPQHEQQQHQRSPSQKQQTFNSNSLGGLDNAFGSLNFSSQPQAAPQATSSPFASLSSPTSPPAHRKGLSIGNGSFFDANPAPSNPPPIPSQPARPQRGFSSSSGFGDFTSAATPAANPPSAPSSQGNGLTGDLFDFSGSSPPAAITSAPLPKNPPPISAANYASPSFDSSVFNLSASKPTANQSQPAVPPKPTSKPVATGGLEDPWGASDVWASNDAPPATTPAAAPVASPAASMTSQAKAAPAPPAMDDSGGWSIATPTASTAPRVTADEDFGGWESQPGGMSSTPSFGAPSSTAGNSSMGQPPPAAPKSGGGGFGGSDDLFSNVWE